MRIENLHKLFIEGREICTDSRNIKKNSLFFALKGENFNGNKYAFDALKKGADYAIVDEELKEQNSAIIHVPNVLKKLQQLAAFHREQLKIPIIGITGSNGKTTTKELLLAVLSKTYRCCATKGNFNNHIGLPLTLLSISQKDEIAIVEMGANHCGEIEELCEIAKPNYGLITNIGIAHLEGFGSFDNIITTKTALFHSTLKNNGIIFVNKNSKELVPFSCQESSVSYGAAEADCVGEITNLHPTVSMKWKTSTTNGRVSSNLIGKYNSDNILAAITLGNYFKISPEKIEAAIGGYFPTNNRSQIIKKNSTTYILDAYNANPSSMKAALESFFFSKHKNPIVVLGDMLELGGFSDKEHQKIVEKLKEENNLSVILVGDKFAKTTNHNFIICKSTQDAAIALNSRKLHNCTILLKGSRGIGLEKIIKN